MSHARAFHAIRAVIPRENERLFHGISSTQSTAVRTGCRSLQTSARFFASAAALLVSLLFRPRRRHPITSFLTRTPHDLLRWHTPRRGTLVGSPATLFGLFIQIQYLSAISCLRNGWSCVTRCPRPSCSTAFLTSWNRDLYSAVPFLPKYRKSVLRRTLAFL